MLKLSVGFLRRGFVLLAMGAGSMFLVNACGEVPGDETRLDSTASAFGQSCGSVTPAQILQGQADVISPATYNQCTKSYVIQVNELQRGGTGGVGVNPNVTFSMGAGGIGMTQAECEQTWVAGYVFEQQLDGTFATQDYLSRLGIWVPLTGSGGVTGRCDTNVSSSNVTEGKTYKLAGTARTAPTSAAPVIPVRIRASR